MLGGVSGLEFQASVLISAEIAEDFDGRELYRFADFPGSSRNHGWRLEESVRLFDRESTGSGGMKYRIAVWASAGFLIAACWALYFANRNKDNPIEPIVYTLARLTQPIVLLVQHSAVSLYWVLVANTVTYALVGLTVEALRRQLSHSR